MNWLSISLAIIILTGFLLYSYGWKKESGLTMLFSGIVVMGSILYWLGWTFLLPFVPVASLIIIYRLKNNKYTRGGKEIAR